MAAAAAAVPEAAQQARAARVRRSVRERLRRECRHRCLSETDRTKIKVSELGETKTRTCSVERKRSRAVQRLR
jgi:hypothetical protein